MKENNNRSFALTVTEMVRQLSNAYTALINSGAPLESFPSVMLWGPPGVGKSQGIRQVAKEIAFRTGKKVNITDVRLLLFNPVDLRGIPTANEDRTLAVWLKPKIFQMDDSRDVINILFLDEISAAPQSVQAAAYQITLDRSVGEHKLPDNCIVAAAGNRVTDRSVAYNMPKALANRLCHIDIAVDSSSWHDWAVGAGINSIVTGFIEYNPDMLMQFDPLKDGLAFPTPRSWEMVSNILNNVSKNIGEVFPLITGCIGSEAAQALRLWSEIYALLPSVEDIFAGICTEVPLRSDMLFALSSRILKYVHSICPCRSELRNAVDYIMQFPPEFRNRLFAGFLNIKALVRDLSEIYVYNDWFLRSGRDWDDYGL